ncbi:hypothetical protein [Paenarthrobacter ilicis]|uniref:Transcriptional regulator n=1 Tax=Paenarthrobacter ilicis TaxID=43665 RepID=A0ABX0TLC9_9MICC|nr:hypothetical protein [Paenarthrobacter ilicis]MBM7791678.1 putative transcriptional regulator [Paenarthrobacter ilicis]NIJ01696.1 putative transcriptional regulator [Paenarthrobacter ilicis]
MGEITAGRVALMSIRPEFADAILSGDKSVEFRKRPVAADVSHVLIYATLPVGSLLGWFEVSRQSTTSPRDLWNQFRNVGGISKDRFFDYYTHKKLRTGIVVGSAKKFDEPQPLTKLGETVRPPQSFQYLTEAQAATFFDMVSAKPAAGDQT